MERRPKIHFSLHFERDFEKLAGITRSIDPKAVEVLPYFDHGAWERLVRTGIEPTRRWADTQIARADVVVVLVGAQTFSRPILRYEIARASAQRRAMFGLALDGKLARTKYPNPFEYVTFAAAGAHRYQIYDWPDEGHAAALEARVAEALRTAR